MRNDLAKIRLVGWPINIIVISLDKNLHPDVRRLTVISNNKEEASTHIPRITPEAAHPQIIICEDDNGMYDDDADPGYAVFVRGDISGTVYADPPSEIFVEDLGTSIHLHCLNGWTNPSDEMLALPRFFYSWDTYRQDDRPPRSQ